MGVVSFSILWVSWTWLTCDWKLVAYVTENPRWWLPSPNPLSLFAIPGLAKLSGRPLPRGDSVAAADPALLDQVRSSSPVTGNECSWL